MGVFERLAKKPGECNREIEHKEKKKDVKDKSKRLVIKGGLGRRTYAGLGAECPRPVR